jgi:two-component system, NtrC family, sensor kinase
MPFHIRDKNARLAEPDDKDLLDRPIFNFRLQIILGFFTFFILSVVITISAMVTINKIEKRIATVQTWDRFLFNIEQARRWEKNFFLYGTNLNDALESTSEAVEILSENINNLDSPDYSWQKEEIIRHLDRYHIELNRLTQLVEGKRVQTAFQNEIEKNLRQYGSQLVQEAAEMAAREYEMVSRWLHLLQKVPAYFLVFLFFLMIYMTRFLSIRFMKPLKYLVNQTRRIAQGDLTPLKPVRKFRDEFTTVEVAINRMLKELENRQKSLIDSHKLRAVGILTAGVAHELNNPLNNIMLTAHTLMEEYQDIDDNEKLDMVRDIIGETDRSRSIVHNLLDFTRESKSVMEPLNLGRLIDETAKLAVNQARVRGIPIQLRIEKNLPDIMGDRQQLKQVFLNLVLNALDAVESGGKIQLHAESRKPNLVIVQVEDNGTGIPADVLPNIFDPFFTTKPVGKGTGLGLSVSHGIITKHGGRISVESKPGRTVFTITLPYFPTPQSAAEKTDSSKDQPR